MVSVQLSESSPTEHTLESTPLVSSVRWPFPPKIATALTSNTGGWFCPFLNFL